VNGQKKQLYKMNNTLYTIGVEEEYMICDKSGNLIDKADLIMDLVKNDYPDRFSYELLLSEIESNTSINYTLKESISEILKYRNVLKNIGSTNNFYLGISGTHPTALPSEQSFVNNDSYNWVSNQLKYYATQNITFSVHVHIGLDNKDKLTKIINTLRRWIGPLLALSTNSPFFAGNYTGMKSSRTFQFGLFPRTEIPLFIKSYNDYCDLVKQYTKLNSISKSRHIWWKIRPHIDFNTIEFRVCDAQGSIDNVELIVGLIQALVRTIDINKEYDYDYQYEYLTDSLWKASSEGLDSTIIDPLDCKIITMRDMVLKMLNYCKQSLEYFNNTHLLKYADKIIQQGTEGDQQIKIFKNNNMDYLKKFLIQSVDY
tara:strand:- start:837 stop:1949 length:1113 start_codon:yes stop_codon:yes gene_type:complete